MTPEDFLNQVVTTNVVKLGENRGSLRYAVNAILSLDAFAGILFTDLQLRSRAPCSTDIGFREILAAESAEFRLVRDAAFALKHGELVGKLPRLVRAAKQVAAHDGGYDPSAFSSGFDTEKVVWIDADERQPADAVALAVLVLLQKLPARYTRT
jgi:hypothetical protein